MDIAGVDLVAEDISRPLKGPHGEQLGAIVEVNAGPGLLMHLKPAVGEPRPVGRAIVDHLFDENESGRIPVVGVTGSKGKTTVSRLVGRMLKLTGKHVGLACGDGLFFDRRLAKAGNCANWAAAHRVLITRSVEAAVFENGCRTILSEGLAYDRCLVGVVTNIDPDDLEPEFYIESADQLANVYRAQVDLVLDNGVAVLNAADARVAEFAALCDGEVIFFSHDPDAAALQEHLFNSGRAVLLREGRIVLVTGAESSVLSELRLIPMAAHAAPTYQTENVLAAIAAAWALGISRELIRAVIQTFDPSRSEATLSAAINA
jgi:cyanophycin synthetase